MYNYDCQSSPLHAQTTALASASPCQAFLRHAEPQSYPGGLVLKRIRGSINLTCTETGVHCMRAGVGGGEEIRKKGEEWMALSGRTSMESLGLQAVPQPFQPCHLKPAPLDRHAPPRSHHTLHAACHGGRQPADRAQALSLTTAIQPMRTLCSSHHPPPPNCRPPVYGGAQPADRAQALHLPGSGA